MYQALTCCSRYDNWHIIIISFNQLDLGARQEGQGTCSHCIQCWCWHFVLQNGSYTRQHHHQIVILVPFFVRVAVCCLWRFVTKTLDVYLYRAWTTWEVHNDARSLSLYPLPPPLSHWGGKTYLPQPPSPHQSSYSHMQYYSKYVYDNDPASNLLYSM